MVCNLGKIDRTIRLVLGIGLGVAGVAMRSHLYGVLLALAGAIVLLEGCIGH